MYMNGHGGNCCGVKHLHSFGIDDEAALSQAKGFLRKGSNGHVGGDYFREYTVDGVKNGKIIEAILTDSQIRQLPRTCAYLKGYGFKLVHRFKNSTGTYCNVLHYCFSTLPNEESPFERVEAEELTKRGTSKSRVPKVGEVWRINCTDAHHYPKNCYVSIRVSEGNFCRVTPVNAAIVSRTGCGSQLLEPDQMSFVRDSV